MTETRLKQPSFVTGLSARLLVLTWIFTMLAEFLIYAPSVARFRSVYLQEQIASAQLASLVIEADNHIDVSGDLIQEVLLQAGARAIALRKSNLSILALEAELPEKIDKEVQPYEHDVLTWLIDAFDTMLQPGNRVLRIIGRSTVDPRVRVEVVMDETPMRKAMYAYSERILILSALISFATATWVYIGLQFLMVLPIRRITDSMVQFRENPDDIATDVAVTNRHDEIGVAQRELLNMQGQIRTSLAQKTRLAALGAAVTKVNHDLRNSLATAMLVSDRLSQSDDPDVRDITPRLINAMDKAVHLCSQTLDFAREQRLRLYHQPVYVEDLVSEADLNLRPIVVSEEETLEGFHLVYDTIDTIEVEVDRDQLVRVFNNLTRNARDAGATKVRVTACEDQDTVTITIIDDGPGMPEKAQTNLFRPFKGSARKGGTGLGLVIARDIVDAHGGDLALIETGPAGTTFRMILPRHAFVATDPPVPVAAQ